MLNKTTTTCLYIQPHWDVSKKVKAVCTSKHLAKTAEQFCQTYMDFDALGLPSQPILLNQVHGKNAINLDHYSGKEAPSADACYTTTPRRVCTIQTADCIPLLVCNQQGTEIAAIHAGWRGLYTGIIHSTIAMFKSSPQSLIVWLGPHIRQKNYQVHNDFCQKFIKKNAAYKPAFTIHHTDCFADLSYIAIYQLKQLGIKHIYDCNEDSYQSEQFYSYRRKPQQQGRTLSMIWLEF